MYIPEDKVERSQKDERSIIYYKKLIPNNVSWDQIRRNAEQQDTS